MLTKPQNSCKAEIMKELRLAKCQVERILLAVELESNWRDIHAQTEKAVFQLKKATKLLAQYHLGVCIFEKHQKANTPIVHEDIDEIIKTYRYLN